MGGAQKDDAEAFGRRAGPVKRPRRFEKEQSDPVVSALFLAEPGQRRVLARRLTFSRR